MTEISKHGSPGWATNYMYMSAQVIGQMSEGTYWHLALLGNRPLSVLSNFCSSGKSHRQAESKKITEKSKIFQVQPADQDPRQELLQGRGGTNQTCPLSLFPEIFSIQYNSWTIQSCNSTFCWTKNIVFSLHTIILRWWSAMQTLERYWFYIFIVFLLFYFASLKTDETSKVAFRLLTYIAINTCHAFIKCCHYDYLQGDYNHLLS